MIFLYFECLSSDLYFLEHDQVYNTQKSSVEVGLEKPPVVPAPCSVTNPIFFKYVDSTLKVGSFQPSFICKVGRSTNYIFSSVIKMYN